MSMIAEPITLEQYVEIVLDEFHNKVHEALAVYRVIYTDDVVQKKQGETDICFLKRCIALDYKDIEKNCALFQELI